MESTDKCLGSELSSRHSEITEEEESAGDQTILYNFTEDTESSCDNAAEDSNCCGSGFHDVKVFLILISLLGTAHGFAVNGVNNVNIPMYERRFQLTSTQTGLIISFYDIVSLAMLVFAGYFMTKVNPPRLLGVASLSLTLGSALMALPHFLTSAYQTADAPPNICYAANDSLEEMCSGDGAGESSSLSNYLYMFLAGQAFHGISGTLLHVVGPAFIDKSVSNRQSPTYISIFFSSILFGPSIGYLFGGWLLTKYVDFPQQPPIELTSSSPAWVGAWWIGFLISAFLGIFIAIPLFTFPAVLPGTEARRRNNVSQAHRFTRVRKQTNSVITEGRDSAPTFFRSLMLFAKNPACLYQCISVAAEALVLGGIMTFITKFLANQFNMDIGFAAIISGLVAVPTTFFGQMTGGAIVTKFNLRVKGILKMNIVVTVIGIGLASGFFVNCDMNNIAGVNHPYSLSSQVSSLSGADGLISECNADCRCDASTYEPVCMNNVQYFSACHAGCSSEMDHITEMYSNCTCGEYTYTSYTNQSMTAVNGKCDNECNSAYIFLTLIGLYMFTTLFLMVPSTTVVLRSADDSQTTFVMAVKQTMMRLFGAVPGPLLFGAVLDHTCLLWQQECGEAGSCWIYENDVMGYSMFIIVAAGKVISLIALGLALKLYVPPPAVEENQDGESNAKV